MTSSTRLIAGLTIVVLATVSARSRAPAPGQSLQDSSTVEAVVADAAGGPPEFGADLLIRIAGSPAITDTARKRELFETAFLRAYGAHESYQRVAPLGRSDKDRDRRALWFSHVRSLLDRDDPLILAALDQSGDFVLGLYARAQRLLAQPRESPRNVPRRGRGF